jgi:hypothetical protein
MTGRRILEGTIPHPEITGTLSRIFSKPQLGAYFLQADPTPDPLTREPVYAAQEVSLGL